jgi:hypothetical protein
MKTIQIECPDWLADRLALFVREGWVVDEQQAMIESLHRYLDAHRPDLIESQIISDEEWDLHDAIIR